MLKRLAFRIHNPRNTRCDCYDDCWCRSTTWGRLIRWWFPHNLFRVRHRNAARDAWERVNADRRSSA